MSIKGLKEALAKKQAQQHPDGAVQDSTGAKITPTAPVRVGHRKKPLVGVDNHRERRA